MIKYERNYCIEVAQCSSEYEMLNNEIKKLYLKRYIMLFNSIVSKLHYTNGTFGTGYPFYVLDENFEGNLPIIAEQLRYNDELLEETLKSGDSTWYCEKCLFQNAFKMEDLKQICKPCPNIEDSLKPRKVINRLPDMDLWMIYEGSNISDVCIEFASNLSRNGFYPSDIDPIKSIEDMKEIKENLSNGLIPSKFIPIDTHIIKYNELMECIESVPNELKQSEKENLKPYIPIHPLSLRKKWQKDDTAYNFILDFLYSFTPYNIDNKMLSLIKQVRKEIADNYSYEDILKWVNMIGSESVAKRNENKELQLSLKRRIQKWK